MSFLWQSLVIIISVLMAGHISRYLGQPSVLGQLLAGVLLGPTLLGWLELTPSIKEMAEIGVILLMFIAGLETNFDDIRRSALTATLVAVGGVALPFLGGWGLAWTWGYTGATAIFTAFSLWQPVSAFRPRRLENSDSCVAGPA